MFDVDDLSSSITVMVGSDDSCNVTGTSEEQPEVSKIEGQILISCRLMPTSQSEDSSKEPVISEKPNFSQVKNSRISDNQFI